MNGLDSIYHHTLNDHASGETSYLREDITNDNTQTSLVHRTSPSRDELENRARTRFLAIWPLVTHFILTILVATVMLVYVHNHYFSITSRRPDVQQADGSVTHWRYILLQTDVTTAVSFALSVMRFVGALWTIPTVWRCIYILLELESISLTEINWMLTWSLPNARIRGRIMVAVILLAAFPAQFSSPILTGSVTWKSAALLVGSDVAVDGISVSTDGVNWVQYRRYTVLIGDTVVERATAIADIAWGGDILNQTNTSTSMKRVLPTTRNLPINSTLTNVTTPYFVIDAFNWITDAAAVPPFSASANFDPFRDAEGPYVGLMPDGTWGPAVDLPDNLLFPQPAVVSETRTMSTLVDRMFNTTNTTGCPNRNGTRYYGDIPSDIYLKPFYYQVDLPIGSVTNCYAYSHVTYRAGVTSCNDCSLSAWTVLELARRDVEPEMNPDPMTLDALALAPNVAHSMILGNFSVPNPYNNIDNFTRMTLARSYQVAWNALSDKFQSSSTSVATRVKVPIQLSQAHVAHLRIYIWVVLNVMLTLSGILFWVVQRKCKKPIVIDAGIAALLLNPAEVLEVADRELNDLSILLDDDSKAVGPLKLEVRDRCQILTARGHKY